jgi:NAD(P)H dehydrogenase (quinone)
MFAFKTDGYTDELKLEMNDLEEADFVLMNFPLWWSSMPAILKGWWDRVAALGFAYHPKDQLYETGIFRGKKAMCCISTGGSQEAYSEGGANGDIYKVIYHINHGLLYYLGMDVFPPFFAWKAHLVDETTLKGYLEDYKKHLENLETFKPLY